MTDFENFMFEQLAKQFAEQTKKQIVNDLKKQFKGKPFEVVVSSKGCSVVCLN